MALQPLQSLPDIGMPTSNMPVDVGAVINSVGQNQMAWQDAVKQLSDSQAILEACGYISTLFNTNPPGQRALTALSRAIKCDAAQNISSEQPKSQNLNTELPGDQV